MEDISQTLALTLGAGWASGINLYAAILVLGFLGLTGRVDLPEGLQVLSDPLVMMVAGFMYLAEFFADKTPGVDTVWDSFHTFIRIPAGALLAAGAVGDIGPGAELAAALAGGSLAAATHAAKAGARVLINTSPEPFSNWGASLAEDVAVVAGLLAAINHPLIFLALLAAFILLLIWLLPKLWRGIKRVFGALGRLFGRRAAEPPGGPGPVAGNPPSASWPDTVTRTPGEPLLIAAPGLGHGPIAGPDTGLGPNAGPGQGQGSSINLSPGLDVGPAPAHDASSSPGTGPVSGAAPSSGPGAGGGG